MKLNEMTKEELKTLSYTDLTNLVLEESKKPISTQVIFKKICALLDYTDSDYENKIGDYYTSLTLDKRFVLLDSHEWDLRERHAVSLDVDDEEDEEETSEEVEEEIEEEEEENIDEEVDDDIDDDDDLDDMSIVDDDSDEEV